MAFSHGKNTVFKIDNAAGSLQDISTYVRSAKFKQTSDDADTTTFGSTYKSFLLGVKDGTITIEGVWDPTVDNILNGILAHATTKTFELGPEGSGTGAIKYTGEAVCMSYDTDHPVKEAATFTAEFKTSGAVTRTTY